jgi:hypothetical protein
MGKGSKPRPFSVKSDVFENNWDAIFGKKSQSNQQDTSKPIEEDDHGSERQADKVQSRDA